MNFLTGALTPSVGAQFSGADANAQIDQYGSIREADSELRQKKKAAMRQKLDSQETASAYMQRKTEQAHIFQDHRASGNVQQTPSSEEHKNTAQQQLDTGTGVSDSLAPNKEAMVGQWENAWRLESQLITCRT